MNVVIYVFAGLFIVLALALVFGYYRTRHPGLLLMAASYGGGAGAALALGHWWPLLAGFAIAWILRLMGLEPGTEGDRR